MRSKITVYLNALRYRVCAVLLEVFLGGIIILGALSYMPFEVGIVYILITPVCCYFWHRQAFNYIRINLKSERLIMREGPLGKRVLNKPLAEVLKIRIDRSDPSIERKTYALCLWNPQKKKETLYFEPKYNIQMHRHADRKYDTPPTKEHYLSHDENFVKFESVCNSILKEYQIYLENSEETEKNNP